MQRINQNNVSGKLIQATQALEAYNPELANKFSLLINEDMQKATKLSHIFIKMMRANHLPEFLFDTFCSNQDKADSIFRGYAALAFEGYPSPPFSKLRKNVDDVLIHEYDKIVRENFNLAVQISPALEVLLRGSYTWKQDKLYLHLLCQHPSKAVGIARGLDFFGTTGIAKFGCETLVQQKNIVEFIINNSENMFDIINLYRQIQNRDLSGEEEKNFIIKNANPAHYAIFQLFENMKLTTEQKLCLYNSSLLGFQQLGVEFLNQITSEKMNLNTLRELIAICSNSNTCTGYYFINSIIYTVKDLYDEISDEYIEYYANKLFESFENTNDKLLYLQRIDIALHILCIEDQSLDIKEKINQLNHLALNFYNEIGGNKVDSNSLLAGRKHFITNTKYQSNLSLFNTQEICSAPHQNAKDWDKINTDTAECKEFQPAGPG